MNSKTIPSTEREQQLFSGSKQIRKEMRPRQDSFTIFRGHTNEEAPGGTDPVAFAPVRERLFGGDINEETAEAELLRLRLRAEIDSLRAEIEQLTETKNRTRADLRRLLEDCLARLDGDGSEEPPPAGAPLIPAAEETSGGPRPFRDLLPGLTGTLFHPAKRRLPLAGGWDQAPMLLVLALIILHQLVPTIQRMALLG